MSLLLCRREPVKHPYYVEVLGIHVYSSQELCYVIYNHPLLVMDDFVDDTLLGFIRSELDMGLVADRMEKLCETGSRAEEVLLLFLMECDYYSEKEIQKFKMAAATFRSLHAAQYEKARADYFFAKHQYGRALSRYEKIVEYPRDNVVDESFLARVYGSLGAACAQLFQFARALAAYDKAYELSRSPEVLKRIYFLSCLAPELEIREGIRSQFKEELRNRWNQEMSQAMLDAGQADEVRSLRALFKKDPLKRLNGASRMIQGWKQEYRQMI